MRREAQGRETGEPHRFHRAAGEHDLREMKHGGEMARLVYMAAISSARKRILLEHSYFVPDDLALRALLDARERGVEIDIITPGSIDANIVRNASRTLWPDLLRAGIRIYEYHPAMLHCKILIVDDFFVSSGSVNFDERSFEINDESNVNVLDASFAARMIADFERDKAQSKPIGLADLTQTPWPKRVFQRFTSLFRPQL